MIFTKLQLFLVLMISIVSNADAQFQRMGIKKGTKLTISANSKGNINTYCMDYTLDAPMSGITYQKILTDPNSARVKFNGEPSKSLQEAIDAGEIIIEGVSMTFETFLKNLDDPMYSSRMTKEELEMLGALNDIYKRDWDKLSQTEKNEINNEFVKYGDHTKMQLINKTKKEVRIFFDDNALLGLNENVKITTLDPVSLDNRNQSEIWIIRNKENQKQLKELGFYEGHIDGNISLETQKAIKDFQIKNGLEPTGKVDPETDHLLKEKFSKKREGNKRLQKYLKSNSNYEGEIDGDIGKKSLAAIDSFKAKYGLDRYDMKMMVWEDKAHMQFKDQHDFINYYRKLDEECNPELCLSDEMSISFTNNCFPGSFSLSTSSGLNMTIEVGTVSYELTLIEAAIKQQNDDGCRLSKGACFSRTLERDYSMTCEEGAAAIEVYATQASLSIGDLNVSLFK